MITAKPTVVKEFASKPASISSNSVDKKPTSASNKTNAVRRTRTAVNIPSKPAANSKAKKLTSAPSGMFIELNY